MNTTTEKTYRVIGKEKGQFPSIEEEFTSLRKAQLFAAKIRREPSLGLYSLRIEDDKQTLCVWKNTGYSQNAWHRWDVGA